MNTSNDETNKWIIEKMVQLADSRKLADKILSSKEEYKKWMDEWVKLYPDDSDYILYNKVTTGENCELYGYSLDNITFIPKSSKKRLRSPSKSKSRSSHRSSSSDNFESALSEFRREQRKTFENFDRVSENFDLPGTSRSAFVNEAASSSLRRGRSSRTVQFEHEDSRTDSGMGRYGPDMGRSRYGPEFTWAKVNMNGPNMFEMGRTSIWAEHVRTI